MKFYVGLCNKFSQQEFNEIIERLAPLSDPVYLVNEDNAAYFVEQWELIQLVVKNLELGKAPRFMNKIKVNTYYAAAEIMKTIYTFFGYEGFTVRPVEKFAYARKR